MADDTNSESAPISRRWLIAAAVAIALSFGAYYFLVLRSNYVTLYDNLRPAQAATIVAVLEDEGAPYRLGQGGTAILVRDRDADRLRLSLEASHAPTGGVEGFELFNESDMGLTDFAQKIRYQRALQGEIARTIMMMQGVADARVHVSMPERTLFRSERRNAEAAVTLIMQPGAEVSPASIEGIQRLVAASVADLNAADVVVLDARGQVLSSRVSVQSLDASAATAPPEDYLIEVTRLALPERRFDVRLEEIPSALEGGDEIVDGPRRLFTITTDSLLAPEERDNVRARFEQAGLIDGSSRNVLTFRVDRISEAIGGAIVSASPEITDGRAPASAQRRTLLAWLPWVVGLALLLVAMVAVFWMWRRSQKPALTFEQHRLMAERLGAALKRPDMQDA